MFLAFIYLHPSFDTLHKPKDCSTNDGSFITLNSKTDKFKTILMHSNDVFFYFQVHLKYTIRFTAEINHMRLNKFQHQLTQVCCVWGVGLIVIVFSFDVVCSTAT